VIEKFKIAELNVHYHQCILNKGIIECLFEIKPETFGYLTKCSGFPSFEIQQKAQQYLRDYEIEMMNIKQNILMFVNSFPIHDSYEETFQNFNIELF
tara:strand:+ start:202 stop:492 length:291 start_codon:yes stop_codon:yes gene_type:complete